MTRRYAVHFVFTLAFLGFLVGCGKSTEAEKGPATEPLRGKVVFTKGGDAKSLYDKQARIEFESVEQPGVHAMGAIEEDGSFTVSTITEGGGSMGVVPGTHRVRIELEENAQKLVAPKFLDFKTSGLTVKVPATEEVKIEVWR